MTGTSFELSTNGSGLSDAAGCGLNTKKSTSSSSRRVGATYLRCCRTKNPCSSKYSRTIVSLTAAILKPDVRRSKRGMGCVGPRDGFRAGGLDRRFGEHFFDKVERHRLSE